MRRSEKLAAVSAAGMVGCASPGAPPSSASSPAALRSFELPDSAASVAAGSQSDVSALTPEGGPSSESSAQRREWAVENPGALALRPGGMHSAGSGAAISAV